MEGSIMKFPFLLVAAGLALAGAARAHVVVVPTMATPGATETLSFVVGHGCSGQPTTALRVELPKSVTAIEPQPKAGWTPTVESLPRGGRAITWRGGEPLIKADGFGVKVTLPKAAQRVEFVAVQSCGDVTQRWDEPIPADGPKPKHPAPTLTLAAAGAAAPGALPAPAPAALPKGLQRLADGGLADARGLPLYTFNYDTMVGMSHCEEDCAKMWPPLIAPKGAKPFDAWTLVRRADGQMQWALRGKPLYAYSKDQPGQPPAGVEAPNWTRAR
jgi:predicted lipoprotein with Yx(FWY)xxD motif